MNRLLALLVVCCAASAQTSVQFASGEDLAALRVVETAAGQRLLLQSGMVLVAFESPGEVAWTSTIPTGAFVWDLAGDDLIAVTDERVVAAPVSGGDPVVIAAAGDVFRGRLTASPAGRPFTATTAAATDFVVPSLESLAWRRRGAKTTEVATVSTIARGKDDLGWGLGYRMSARVTVPFFTFADGDGDGANDLLYRAGGELRLRTERADHGWGKTPASENTRMLKFEHAVPPLAHDHDGDGRIDLVMVDPGEGYVFCYRGAARPAEELRGPDQLLKLDAWVLWRWLVDADGDGRLDLVLLTMPKVGLLGQIGVVNKRAVSGRLSVRLQQADGSFAVSPAIKNKMQLPISISVTRDRKDIRFRTPVVPLRSGEGFAFLGPDAEGASRMHVWRDETWTAGEALPVAVVEEGYVDSAFEPALSDLDGDGEYEISFLIRGQADGRDRAVMLR